MNDLVYAIYVASVLGAASLFLMMPRRGFNPRKLGALLGASTLGGLWLYLARSLPETFSPAGAVMVYYYIFSALAIGAAVRVITHPKPVFSALWFVMVVLASAGLFLVLDAEFVAFAMVIIYGGAILVTYVFVIMLAAQSGDPTDQASGGSGGTEYDRVAREPAAAILAGFLLLALLLSVMFRSMEPNPRQRTVDVLHNAQVQATLANRPANDIHVLGEPGDGIDNVERVGLDLFQNHPLGIELAGVILLVSLVGAVVIARQYVPPETPEGSEATQEAQG